MQKIEELISQNRLEEAIKSLESQIESGCADDNTHFTLGRVLWRLGRRGEAIDAYNKAVAINPNSPAAIALDQAHEIFDFFNPDLLNP